MGRKRIPATPRTMLRTKPMSAGTMTAMKRSNMNSTIDIIIAMRIGWGRCDFGDLGSQRWSLAS